MSNVDPVVKYHTSVLDASGGLNTDIPIEFLNPNGTLPPVPVEFDDSMPPMTLAEVETAISENPDLYRFDPEADAQEYGISSNSLPTDNGPVHVHGLGIAGVSMNNSFNANAQILGGDDVHMDNNSFNGMPDELNAQTPGYFDFDPDTAYYPTIDSPLPGSNTSQNYQALGLQDPFTEPNSSNPFTEPTSSNPYMESSPFNPEGVRTPYVAKTPYILDDDDNSMYNLANAIGFNASQSPGFQSFSSTAGFNPSMSNEPAIAPATTGKAAKATKKTPKKTTAKAATKKTSKGKAKSRAIIVDSDADEDYDDNQPIRTTTTKGGKKRAAPNTNAAPAAKKTKKTTATKASAAAETPAKTASTPATPAEATSTKTTAAAATPAGGRIRAAPQKPIKTCKTIPHSFEECDDADKALITMRREGNTWAQILPAMTALTGEEYGHSTLPNRYERLMVNFTSIREDDKCLLVEAHSAVQKEFESKKWGLITEKLVEMGGTNYEAQMLQRGFKKLMNESGFDVEEGKRRGDVDFVGSDGEEIEEGREDRLRLMEEAEAEEREREAGREYVRKYVEEHALELDAEEEDAEEEDAEGEDVIMEDGDLE